MDVLKRELLDADFGGRQVLRRAEIEARELQRIRETERQRLLQKRLLQGSSLPRRIDLRIVLELPSHLRRRGVAGAQQRKRPRGVAPEGGGHPAPAGAAPAGHALQRGRRRLHEVLEDPAALADVDAAEIREGQTNDFLRDIQALRAKAASKPKPRAAAQQKEGEEREIAFEDLCDEDKIAAFFRRLMGEWSQEVDEMPEAERQTAAGQNTVATCKQSARYLDPLFKQCKKKNEDFDSNW